MAEGLYGQGYCIIVDNLYTSPEPLLALYKNNVDCYGTLRKKEGLPKDFWSWKPKKEVGVEPIRKFCDQKFMVMLMVMLMLKVYGNGMLTRQNLIK